MSIYDDHLQKWQERIQNAELNEEMKTTLLKFDKLWGTGIRPATRIFYLKCLKIFAEYFKDKSPSQITKDDMIAFFDGIASKRGARLVEQTKIAVKKFFKELCGTEGYPEIVKWIKPLKNIRPAVTREMLLANEEILKIVEVCDNARDRAFIMVLAESACRIGEILGLKLKDVTFGENVTSINVNGKTGFRKVPLLHSVPQLKEWVNQHPTRDNIESPLWVCIGRRNFGQAVKPDPLRARMHTIAKQAGIKKRVFFHLFRHSQLTQLVRSGYSEFYLKKHAGWTGSSEMAQVYVHLAFDDVERRYLEINGIAPEAEVKENVLKPKTCVRCGEVNPATNKVCNKCLYVLDLKAGLELDEKRKELDDLMNKLFQSPQVKKAIEAELSGMVNK